MHPAIQPISWLVGNWGGHGHGQYPTIKPFNYEEQASITHPALHQPVIHLDFSSWFVKENNQKQFAHFEKGFIKVKPTSDPIHVTYVSSHNNGLSIAEEGTYDPTDKRITLESTNIGRLTINKPPAVLKTRREIKLLADGKIEMKMFMSTSTNPSLDEHLCILYEKLE